MSAFEFQRHLPFKEFEPNGSFIQRLNPITILVITLAGITGGLAIGGLLQMGILLAICLLLLGLGRISIPALVRSILPALPFLLIIAVMNVIWNPNPEEGILLQTRLLTLSRSDIAGGCLLLVRFLVIILVINLASGSLSISGFLHGLEVLFTPLRWIGLPVIDFIMVVQITIRFIPILTRMAERIAKAQASRGAAWGTREGGLAGRVRQVVPVLVPLFISSIQRADTLALAMEARGYALSARRTSVYNMKMRAVDIVVIVASLGLVTVLILWAVT